ncbi:MAG: hypothetical protein AB7R89_06075 [Dehalococcoidia bacterium]
MTYVYLGDTLTDPALVGQPCDPVRWSDGRRVVGQGKAAGRALVVFGDGRRVAVLRRRLRLREKGSS